MIFITCFPSNIFWYDRTLENTAENGKVFLFADTWFNNENPHVSCRKCNISVSYVAKKIMDVITKNVSVQGGNRLLKLSLKQGEYLNIGDNIRVVYAGGHCLSKTIDNHHNSKVSLNGLPLPVVAC